mmetsp:Transcript_75259/g.218546  ORF Transcript_75259/g.218546 Transcript_75259/m.218546 type:complete len:201 (-) Transcript_75259:182-784(-)
MVAAAFCASAENRPRTPTASGSRVSCRVSGWPLSARTGWRSSHGLGRSLESAMLLRRHARPSARRASPCHGRGGRFCLRAFGPPCPTSSTFACTMAMVRGTGVTIGSRRSRRASGTWSFGSSCFRPVTRPRTKARWLSSSMRCCGRLCRPTGASPTSPSRSHVSIGQRPTEVTSKRRGSEPGCGSGKRQQQPTSRENRTG